MRKVFNFNAGPSMLPEEVLLEAQKEMLDWHGTGMSIMELGHRGPEFKAMAEEAEADLRDLMSIPKNYHVLFIAGGATIHFAMIPMNLLRANKKADYVDTGIWSRKAIDEAKRYGQINIVAELQKIDGLFHIPKQNEWHLDSQADYLHYTPNETISGVEFHWVPESGKIPLIADMSSMILSQPVDVSKYGLIYAGAQKNIGQAGISVVIIRDDLAQESQFLIPTLYQYKTHIENKSFYNTPPTYSWYIAGLMFKWLKRQGGVAKIYEKNKSNANKLYQFIDQHPEFYRCTVYPDSRSLMNVAFNMRDEELTNLFLAEATKAGLANLKGHRLSGGIRASMYNAMPEEGVDALIDFMKAFEHKHA